ncbi:MAG TPA: hypothetical protein VKP61_08760 [Candidatus Acidoferrum sp.]|nr:hypothetical protein [Candidatus Acidoferrum sp.]
MRKKGNATWWILTQEDEVLVKHYSGPDRKRAREVAGKLVQSEKEKEVLAVRVSALTVIRSSDLKAALPKDAF